MAEAAEALSAEAVAHRPPARGRAAHPRRDARRAGARAAAGSPRRGRRREPRAHRAGLRGLDPRASSRPSRSRWCCCSSSARWRATSTRVAVRIGRENASFGLGETSVVSSAFAIPGRDVSRLGIVGPDPHGLLQQHGGRPRRRPLPLPHARRELTPAADEHDRHPAIERTRPPWQTTTRSSASRVTPPPTRSRRRTAASRASSTPT